MGNNEKMLEMVEKNRHWKTDNKATHQIRTLNKNKMKGELK